jgi:hypothetical protein
MAPIRVTAGQRAAVCALALIGVGFVEACRIVGCGHDRMRPYVPRDWRRGNLRVRVRQMTRNINATWGRRLERGTQSAPPPDRAEYAAYPNSVPTLRAHRSHPNAAALPRRQSPYRDGEAPFLALRRTRRRAGL